MEFEIASTLNSTELQFTKKCSECSQWIQELHAIFLEFWRIVQFRYDEKLLTNTYLCGQYLHMTELDMSLLNATWSYIWSIQRNFSIRNKNEWPDSNRTLFSEINDDIM